MGYAPLIGVGGYTNFSVDGDGWMCMSGSSLTFEVHRDDGVNYLKVASGNGSWSGKYLSVSSGGWLGIYSWSGATGWVMSGDKLVSKYKGLAIGLDNWSSHGYYYKAITGLDSEVDFRQVDNSELHAAL